MSSISILKNTIYIFDRKRKVIAKNKGTGGEVPKRIRRKSSMDESGKVTKACGTQSVLEFGAAHVAHLGDKIRFFLGMFITQHVLLKMCKGLAL